MREFLGGLMMLLWAMCCQAQQRHATVTLDDGKVLEGEVIAMDIASMQISVGGAVQTVPVTHIQSCRFLEPPPVPASEPAQEPPAETAPAPAAPSAPPTAAHDKPPQSKPRAVGPIELPPVPEFDPEAVPMDLRRRSLFRSRMEALDEAYPWLCPTAPAQWGSLGFLLFTLMTLVVHLSTKVCGVESLSLGRSMGITGWYLCSGFVQIALVPVYHFTTVAMLIGNTAMALFALRSLFRMSRGAAVLAFATQLGFVVLGYGILQLIDALLKSVGTAHP